MNHARFHIVEACMDNKIGHAYWFARRLAEAAEAEGYAAKVYANDAFPAADWQGVGEFEPVLSATPFDQLSQDELAAVLENHEFGADRLAAQLVALSDQIDPDRDRLVLPTVNDILMRGIALWLERVPEMRRLKGGIMFGLPCGIQGDNRGYNLSTVQWRAAFNRLGETAMVLVAATDTSRSQYEMLAKREVILSPMPVISWPPRQDRPARDEVFTILFPGSGHDSQRFDLIGYVLDELRARDFGPVRIVQQAGIVKTETAKLEDTEWVRVPRGLDGPVYSGLYADSDCIMLLYEIEKFTAIMSGQFALAVELGVPTLVPAGTTMSLTQSEVPGAGLTFNALDPNEIADRLISIRDNIQIHRGQAKRLADWFKAHHGMGAFCKSVMEVLR